MSTTSNNDDGYDLGGDITMSDRLSTEVKTRILIDNLKAQVELLEEELKQHKTELAVVSDPDHGHHDLKIKAANGVTKTVTVNNESLSYYAGQGNPTEALITDALEVLAKPYHDMIRAALRPKVQKIFENFVQSHKSQL